MTREQAKSKIVKRYHDMIARYGDVHIFNYLTILVCTVRALRSHGFTNSVIQRLLDGGRPDFYKDFVTFVDCGVTCPSVPDDCLAGYHMEFTDISKAFEPLFKSRKMKIKPGRDFRSLVKE